MRHDFFYASNTMQKLEKPGSWNLNLIVDMLQLHKYLMGMWHNLGLIAGNWPRMRKLSEPSLYAHDTADVV